MTRKSVPLAPWGMALEELRKGKDLTLEDLFHRRITTSGEYYRICRSKTGPGVKTLNGLIVGMGYNWHDWAAALEKSLSENMSPIEEKKDSIQRMKTHVENKKRYILHRPKAS